MPTLDWLIIIFFLILILAIGISLTKRAGKNLSSFFLGGRNLPWYIAGISMVATTFAADTPLLVAGLIATEGISGNWLWWNFLLGGMLTAFFFSRLWRRAEVMTEVEFIELRYSGRVAAFLRGFKAIYLGLFMNVIIIGWVNFALITVLQGFFDMSREDAFLITALAMLFVAVYSSLSGLLGIAITDNIQFVIAMAGCIILAVLTVNSPEIGGIGGLKASLSGDKANALKFLPDIGQSGTNAGYALTIGIGAFLARIGLQSWSSWYPGAEPGGGGYIVQRMLSTKNERHSLYATLLFQVAHYCLRPWPWIVVGLCALVLYPELGPQEKEMGFVLAMKDFLPTGLRGLLLVAFFAAYMSTISTQLNWGASYMVNDLYKRFIIKPRSDKSDTVGEDDHKKLVRASRIVTVMLMIIALVVTSQIQTIRSVWDFVFQCGAGLGLVLILRWYWWRVNAWSELSASVAPFVGFYLSEYQFGFDFAQGMLFTVSFTTIVWLVVTFLTPPDDMAHLSRFYKKVYPGGFWKPVRQVAGMTEEKNRMWPLFLAWIVAIIFTYSLLFLTGKIILQEWTIAAWLGLTCTGSLTILIILIKKARLFE